MQSYPFHGSGAQVQAIAFAYQRSPDQDAPQPVKHPIVVVGAGPVGLSLAIDLAQRGQAVVLLEAHHSLSVGSRALCFAKRSLEIWDRLGVGQTMVDKGVSWQVGKVFFKGQALYQFDLLPEAGHERPAFINLQQYYAESFLMERALQLPLIDLRWDNAVSAVDAVNEVNSVNTVNTESSEAQGTVLTVQTPQGPYRIHADWVIACDGSRSGLRKAMGLESKGRVFKDRFLIADVKMHADFPSERWFWFDPPFHPKQSVLLHRQPDHVWRIDFQLGWDADPEHEKKPENIIPRVQALLGKDADFSLEWASVYTFACQRMERFVHERVIFAGDSAHGVSPFGARGANSGVQDADNLAWKLDMVLRGHANAALIQTYGQEREAAADENILHSTRATDFITPKSDINRLFRDAVLHLAGEHSFAQRLVNSGRLSVPAVLHHSPLNTPDADVFVSAQVPGAVLADAPMQQPDGRAAWLLRSLGPQFSLLVFGPAAAELQALPMVHTIAIGQDLLDAQGLLAQRLDAQPGTAYLIRPDQHICARWRAPSAADVQSALARALAQPPKDGH